jgi:hypothetical protein
VLESGQCVIMFEFLQALFLSFIPCLVQSRKPSSVSHFFILLSKTKVHGVIFTSLKALIPKLAVCNAQCETYKGWSCSSGWTTCLACTGNWVPSLAPKKKKVENVLLFYSENITC